MGKKKNTQKSGGKKNDTKKPVWSNPSFKIFRPKPALRR